MKHLNTPGQALLITFQRAMSPEQRPAFDGFVRRNLDALSTQLDEWILADSLQQSRCALPDVVLFGADDEARETLLLPLLGNYWAMHALVRRGAERGEESREMVTRLLEHYALRERRTRDEDASIAAATGTPPKGWAPPVYSRASPVDMKTAKGRATLARRLVAALARLPARSVPALHREVGGTPPQVRATLKRLAREGAVWSYTLQGHKKYDEALQQDVKLWDLTEGRTELPHAQYDEVVLATLRREGKKTRAELQALVGGSSLDVRASLDRLGKQVWTSISGQEDFWWPKDEGPPIVADADRGEGGELNGPSATGTRSAPRPKERLPTVIDAMNERFDLNLGGQTGDLLSRVRDDLVGAEDMRRAATVNDKANFAHVFTEGLSDMMANHHADNTDFVNLFFEDRDLREFLTERLLDEVYGRIRSDDDPPKAAAEIAGATMTSAEFELLGRILDTFAALDDDDSYQIDGDDEAAARGLAERGYVTLEDAEEWGLLAVAEAAGSTAFESALRARKTRAVPSTTERGSDEIKALAESMPTEYLRRLFEEKEIPERLFEVHGGYNTHHIPNAVVVERISRSRGLERRRIEDTLRRIDSANGDINDFLRHLADGLARQYDFASDWNDADDDDDVKRWTPSR